MHGPQFKYSILFGSGACSHKVAPLSPQRAAYSSAVYRRTHDHYEIHNHMVLLLMFVQHLNLFVCIDCTLAKRVLGENAALVRTQTHKHTEI